MAAKLEHKRITTSIAVLVLGASIQVALALYYSSGGMIDDSFISFRYAENLAAGYGPVYNPGDPPVEGYSNLLWVLALAALSATGLGTVVAAKWLGILCAVGILICAWLLAEELAAERWSKVLLVMLISTAPPIAVYAVSGMETLLYGLLIVSFLFTFIREEQARELHQRRFPLSGTLGALLCLTRPEGFIILGPFVAYRTIIAAGASTPDGRHQYFLWIGQIAGAIVGLTVWRLVYYGHLLPMPVYAKVTGEYGYRGVRQILGGTKYFLTFAKEYGGVVAIFLVLWAALREAAGYVVKLASTRGGRPLREGEGRLVVAVFLLWYVFFCVNVGGDFMPQFRFYVPLLPIFYVSLVTRPLSDLLPHSCIVVVCVALLGYNVLAIPNVSYNEISSRTHVIEKYKEMGDVLQGATLATSQAGALPYYTGLRTIDMMGLNDEYIAMAFRRSRGLLGTDESVYGEVVEYILSQSPEVLHIGGGLMANRPYHEAIMNSKQFRENYKEWSDYSSQNDWFYLRKDIEVGEEGGA